MKPLRDCRLYAFVDTAYLHGRQPDAVARLLCEGGADIIQLRAKASSQDEIRRMAESILPVTTDHGVLLVLNDHPKIAFAVGAVACHLGQEDFFGAGHTRVSEVAGTPARLQIGLSTHSPEQAIRALQAQPDYIAIGPVNPTHTKPDRRATGLSYVRWAAQNVNIPWFAIGGITLGNLEEVLVAGATRICAVSTILNAPDPAAACRQFKERLPDS